MSETFTDPKTGEEIESTYLSRSIDGLAMTMIIAGVILMTFTTFVTVFWACNWISNDGAVSLLVYITKIALTEALVLYIYFNICYGGVYPPCFFRIQSIVVRWQRRGKK